MNQLEESVYDPSSLPDILPIYYKRIFPHIPFYRWISYGRSELNIYSHREFSFVLVSDIYVRFLSFETQQDLEKEICTQNPLKIDIGAVMTAEPKKHPAIKMECVQKELVFDIDMTDYNDVRTCCKESDICVKCWKYMTVACNILDAALREDFGFEHLLWVFSGRRGIHCWVCDRSARHLNIKARCAIAEYLHIFSQNTNNERWSRITIGDQMHHSVSRAQRFCESMFEEIVLIDQNLFGTVAGLNKLLNYVPDEQLRKELEIKLKPYEGTGDSITIWKIFKQFFEILSAHGSGGGGGGGGGGVGGTVNSASIRRTKYIVEEIQLLILYPRLDINVTTTLNHLLKAPFCVHPKTGKVCIPFKPNVVDKFDPTAVPTITSLMKEIDSFDQKKQNELKDSDEKFDTESRIKDYRKTSLYKGIRVFEEFLRKLEGTWKGKSKLIDDEKMEF